MGIGKQAKTLNKSQIEMLRGILRSKRNGLRNETIFLLSIKSGLRSKEISMLNWKIARDWEMVRPPILRETLRLRTQNDTES